MRAFLKKERLQEQTGELHGEAIRELFEELRGGLPLRHQFAPHGRAKRKIEWMRDYVNRSLAEHGLSDDYRVVLSPAAK